MYEYQRILGDRVKAARKERGLTQEQLAARVHSNKRTILDIENYRGNPKLETLFELLSFLEIDPFPIVFPKPEEKSEGIRQLELLLHSCSEEQIKMLVPICKSILDFAEASNRTSAI